MRRTAFLRHVVLATFLVAVRGTVIAQGPVPAGAFVQVVPHILSGGGCGFAGVVTKLTLVNTANSVNQITINNVRQDGTLLDSTPNSIPAGGVLRLQTPENQRTAPGCDVHWAMVGSQQPVNINLFFEIGTSSSPGGVTNTVGFNDVVPATSFTLPVELQKGTLRTLGLAVANRANAAQAVTLKLFDANGAQAGNNGTINLAAFGQAVASVENFFSAALPAGDFVGKLVVTAPSPFAALGVGDDFGPFFSVQAPVAAAAGASSVLSATFTMGTNISVSPASCTNGLGVTVPGATTTMTAVISPAGDPAINGLDTTGLTWDAFVDAADHVTVRFCKFGRSFAVPAAPQVFNIRLISTNAVSATTTLTLAGGPADALNNTQTVVACIQRSTALPGATAQNVVAISPASDTAANGWTNVLWKVYVATPGQVTAHFCAFTNNAQQLASGQTFNIAMID